MMRRPLYPYEAFAGESIEASELLAGEHVEMDVVHGLSGELADVRDHAVAICEALLLRKLRDDGVDVANQRLIFFRHLRSRGKMLLRNYEKMLGCQRRDVQKREALIVLIDLRGRDFSRDDLTKQAISHGSNPPA